MTAIIKKITTITFCIISGIWANAKFIYKPALGDKFVYEISYKNMHFKSAFIYDIKNKLPTFHFKWTTNITNWESWTESKTATQTLVNDPTDTGLLKNCNLIYLNEGIYKQLKLGNNFKLSIQKTHLEFILTNTIDYDLPINNASIKLKKMVATSTDGKWIIHILDNAAFPLITAILGDLSWQLQTIVPVPMFPITQNLIGSRIDDKNAKMFNNYIEETCVNVDVKFSENFKKVSFNEYFCPIVGIRFSVKNDSIISLKLISSGAETDGYYWQTYRGYIWGIFSLGDRKIAIEKKLGKPISIDNGKSYYPDKGFYLIYNNKGELERVEYE